MSDDVSSIAERARQIIDEPQRVDDPDAAWWWSHEFLARFAQDVLSLVAERSPVRASTATKDSGVEL